MSEDRTQVTYSEISACLTLGNQRSFMLPAAAGAGKTGALVETIRRSLEINEDALFFSGAQVAAITYTRAAAAEIHQRLAFDTRVRVSTIHSFAWAMIQPHPLAIRESLLAQTEERLAKDRVAKSKERITTGPTAKARMRRIERAERRMEQLPNTTRFFYSPNAHTPERDELGHSEVLSTFSDLLARKPLLQSILVGRFPILLIDEAQDTSKSLLPTLIEMTREYDRKFTLGLFGDLMQRVYLDGVPDLGKDLPPHWATIQTLDKNRRSDVRIVDLANSIRRPVFANQDQAPESSALGTVRFFSFPSGESDSRDELRVRQYMANVTGDPEWNVRYVPGATPTVKTLVLEHRIAATRLGFEALWDVMSSSPVKEQLFGPDEDLPPFIAFLAEVSALVYEISAGNLRRADRLLAAIRSSQEGTASTRVESVTHPESAQQTMDSPRIRAQAFKHRVETSSNTRSIVSVLEAIKETGVFNLSVEAEDCLAYLNEQQATQDQPGRADTIERDGGGTDQQIFENWADVIKLPLSEFAAYLEYRSGRAEFDTQQGVKGLEFPRVIVILSDAEARGKLYQYDRYVAETEGASARLETQIADKETVADRTRRLFYVSCTRAKNSLAIIHRPKLASSESYSQDFSDFFSDGEMVSWEQLLESTTEP
ncbi:DNA helicase-2/ATP-dependent DNA helicase PcrA [Mycolicibacterium mucogenicum 261Sha1.1M5]|nr:DNA helicase-2/ATP-dependent DNA helicase PcrA [Mycolicibacterium mucogenicum 261Sha1.1M5]